MPECWCLIAGGAAEESLKSGEIEAKRADLPEGAKGNLNSATDVELMRRKIRQMHGQDVHLICFDKAGTKTKKQEVVAGLKETMKHENPHIFYSGHGAISTGDWCFEDDTGKTTEFLTFDELIAMWSESPAKTLGIVVDACHSGFWVERAKGKELRPEGLDKERLFVQASCSAVEKSWDTSNGGAFTRAYTSLDLMPPMAKDCKDYGAKDIQTPMYGFSLRPWGAMAQRVPPVTESLIDDAQSAVPVATGCFCS